MTQEHLIKRLEMLQRDTFTGSLNLIRQSLICLIDEIKAEGVAAPADGLARQLFALPKGSKVTIEIY